MIAPRPTLCVLCKHFDKDSASPVTCAAFPQGIPDEYWDGLVSHMLPTRGEDVAFEGAIPFGYETWVPNDEDEDVNTEPDEVVGSRPAVLPTAIAGGWTPPQRIG